MSTCESILGAIILISFCAAVYIFKIKPIADLIDHDGNKISKDFCLALKIIRADIGFKNSILAQADMDEESRKAMARSIQDAEMLLTKYERFLKSEVDNAVKS